jgi:hypothetical protein
MTGERERNDGRCLLCGGRLLPKQRSTIPFSGKHGDCHQGRARRGVCQLPRVPYDR